MNGKNNSLYKSIVIMGPMKIGKGTISDTIARNLGLEHVYLYSYLWANIGNDLKIMRDSPYYPGISDSDLMLEYIKNKEYMQIECLKKVLDSLNKRVVLELASPFGVLSNKDYLKEVVECLKRFKNVFVLLPSTDTNESIKYLETRAENIRYRTDTADLKRSTKAISRTNVCNKYLLESTDYLQYNANLIYTKDKSNFSVVREIKQLIKK